MEEVQKLKENQTVIISALYDTVENKIFELKNQNKDFYVLLDIVKNGLETYDTAEKYQDYAESVFFILREYAGMQAEKSEKLYSEAYQCYIKIEENLKEIKNR